MAWIFAPLLISLLLVTPFQAAHGEVLADARRGPACRVDNAGKGYCWLHVEIRGEITAADFNEINRLLEQTRREAQSKNWEFVPPLVELNTLGGSVSAAMAIGRLLRKERASAQIWAGKICYSSCVLILAGAVRRTINMAMPPLEAKVGIHRPYLPVPKGVVSPDQVTELFQKTLQDIRAYFREMNVSEQLADAMLRINPENMRLLNDAALKSYGLTSTDPIVQEIDELQSAKGHGLTREEYMRRKVLAQKRCGNDFSNSCYERIMSAGQVPMGAPTPEELAPDFSRYGR